MATNGEKVKSLLVGWLLTMLVFSIAAIGLILYLKTQPPAPQPAQPEHFAAEKVSGERHETAYGTPTSDITTHHGYIRGYCGKYTTWVCEYLTANTLKGDIKRADHFKADPDVPEEFRSTPADYKKSGEQMGHCAPAADMHGSQAAMTECFLLSNMMPQIGQLNEHTWAHLEKFIRDLTNQVDEVWVFTGPAWLPDKHGTITFKVIGKNGVWVPTHCWKTALAKKGNDIKLYAWILPNSTDVPADFNEGLVSVDSLEAAVGLDFWTGLPDKLENALELSPATTAH